MIPKYIIIHHSASSPKTTIKQIEQWHKARGFGGVGYHYVITNDGNINTCRNEDEVGCHCVASSMNFQSIGICVTGDFTKDTINEAQEKALKILIYNIQHRYDIPDKNVLCHNEVKGARTECPGKLLEVIKAFREDKRGSIINLIKRICKIN